jgi:hypothetical protein
MSERLREGISVTDKDGQVSGGVFFDSILLRINRDLKRLVMFSVFLPGRQATLKHFNLV